jgi:xanthine/CO dehydrogenase XdhC/CoxF family maturation factor
VEQSEHTKVMGALVNRGDPFMATVVKTKASSLGKPGFEAVILGAGGDLRGSMGGACPESAITAEGDRDCLEPLLPPQRLILIGQGGKDEVEDELVSWERAQTPRSS